MGRSCGSTQAPLWLRARTQSATRDGTFCGRRAFRNLDLGLSRYIALTERTNLEFRAEAFNIFNTPQFGFPNATLGLATTGTISSVVNPQRELQFCSATRLLSGMTDELTKQERSALWLTGRDVSTQT